MIDNFNSYHELYVSKVEKKQNGLLVNFPEKTSRGLNKIAWIKYDKIRSQWFWKI